MPELRLDGSLEPAFFYTYERIQTAYDQRKTAPTDVTIEIFGNFDDRDGEVSATAVAGTGTPLPPGDYRLHLVLTESGIVFDAPNGLDIHDHTMRRMSPDSGGHPVTFAGEFPQSAEASAQFLLDPAYDIEHCRLVAFLQDASTREVHQSVAVLVTELTEPTATAEATWSAVKHSYRTSP